MGIRQSFSWWCFEGRGASDETLLTAAKEIGYEAVELLPDNKLHLAAEFGLRIASHPGHRLEANGLNSRANHDAIEASILANLSVATQFQIPNLIVFSGERNESFTEEEAIENTAAGLLRVAAAAEDAGVNLIMELLNSRVDHRGYQCDSTRWGAAVCNRVGSPNVGLLYDIYHMQIMEGDVIRTIQANSGHILHYHTAGNPGRNDLDETQELNYPAIFRAIRNTGYAGMVGHEFIPKGDPCAALESAFRLFSLAV